jgi:hypothetical protein
VPKVIFSRYSVEVSRGKPDRRKLGMPGKFFGDVDAIRDGDVRIEFFDAVALPASVGSRFSTTPGGGGEYRLHVSAPLSDFEAMHHLLQTEAFIYLEYRLEDGIGPVREVEDFWFSASAEKVGEGPADEDA